MYSNDIYSIVYQKAKEEKKLPAFMFRKSDRSIEQISYYDFYTLLQNKVKEIGSLSYKRVAIIGRNSAQWVLYAWSTLASGKDLAPMDSSLSVEDMARMIEKSDIDLIIMDADLRELKENLMKIFESHSYSLGFLFMSEDDVTISKDDDSEMVFDELTEEEISLSSKAKIFCFSSGTTQNSKTIVGTTDIYIGDYEVTSRCICFEKGKIALNALPFHYAYSVAINPFYFMSGCPIFISNMRDLKKDVKEVQPVMMPIVPSAAEFLIKKKGFVPSVKYLLVSGAFCSKELAASLRSLGMVVQNRYGCAEVPCAIGENRPEDDVDQITVHDFLQVEISPEGELMIHSKYHFDGYYNDPDRTAEVLVGDTYYTGDMALLDSEGRLQLLGRCKNLIVMNNGEKIFASDIDEALKSLEGVEDGAVIYKNQMLIAVLNLREDSSEEKIKEKINEYNEPFAYHRRIRDIWIYDGELPYTSSGKLKRRVLEDEWEELNAAE